MLSTELRLLEGEVPNPPNPFRKVLESEAGSVGVGGVTRVVGVLRRFGGVNTGNGRDKRD
jgi:hypothetical protein